MEKSFEFVGRVNGSMVQKDLVKRKKDKYKGKKKLKGTWNQESFITDYFGMGRIDRYRSDPYLGECSLLAYVQSRNDC